MVRTVAVEVDAHGVAGEGGGKLGRGHNEGASEREGIGRIENVAAIDGDAGSSGEAGDGAGDEGVEAIDVVKGEDVVVESCGEEVVFAGRRALEGRGGWVNESPDCAGEGGLSCCDWAGWGKEGVWPGGGERGERADEWSGEGGALGEGGWGGGWGGGGGGVGGGGGGGGGGCGEEGPGVGGRESGSQGVEESGRRRGWVLPGIDEVLGGGGDFEEFVVFVGEVEEDGLRAAGVAAPADAGEDFAGRHLGISGVSGEHCEGAVHGVAADEE